MIKQKRGVRAVSPIIATVLLISIVAVIAILILIWATYFVKEAVMKNGVSIDQVCSELSLDASLDGTSLLVMNKGSTSISSLELRKTKAGNTETQRVTGLGAGAGGEYEVGDYEEIEIVPVLIGEVKNSKMLHVCENRKIDVK